MSSINLNSNWIDKICSQKSEFVFLLTPKSEITYKQFQVLVNEGVKKLSKFINENEIVAVPAEHTLNFLVNLFALWKLGAVVLSLNPFLSDDEKRKQIEFIDCKSLDNLSSSGVSKSENSLNRDTALILFTSGTTGKPKAIQHTFQSLFASTSMIDKKITLNENERWLASLPFYRIGGFQIILRSFLSGGILCLPEKINTKSILAGISEFKPHYVSLVNATLESSLKSKIAVENFKALFVGGGPVNSELMMEGIKRNLPLYKVYGSTETGSMISLLKPKEAELKIESAGRPLPGVQIKTDNGEIIVNSPTNFTGYYKNEELTNIKLKDGWYYSGDIGSIDKDGYLFIEKRIDNIIISGGEKVDPAEIENLLLSYENINEAVVVGVNDKRWGKKICVVVTSSKNIDTEELINRLKELLPSYKVPKEIRRIDSIPTDQMGKVDRLKIERLFS